MFKWMVKKINNKKGFTLIELVVVIAILGILSAIAIPRFTDATANAKRRAVEANLRTIEGAIAMYQAQGNDVSQLELETDPVQALVDADVLQAKPEGPDGVKYDIENGKATAKIADGSETPSWWTAKDNSVSLPIDWEGSGDDNQSGGESEKN